MIISNTGLTQYFNSICAYEMNRISEIYPEIFQNKRLANCFWLVKYHGTKFSFLILSRQFLSTSGRIILFIEDNTDSTNVVGML